MNINVAFGIILQPSEYLTHFSQENDSNDTVHNLSKIITLGRFHQYNYTILTNDYNSTNTCKTIEPIQSLIKRLTESHITNMIKT